MISVADVNNDYDDSRSDWRRSSRSYGGGNCVEASVRRSGRIAIRDSKNPGGAVLQFASAEWNAFVANVRRD